MAHKGVVWPRHYRVVKLVIDSNAAWLVVSSSLRDDETWDVIYRGRSREACFRYIDDIHQRNETLRKADLA